MTNNEFRDASIALTLFELWIEGKIDHNIAVPFLFNIPNLEKYRKLKYSDDFLNAFEEAVEYETIRSIIAKEKVVQTENKIMEGFKKAVLRFL